MADMNDIRAKARQHQQELDEPRWMTIAEVAARFRLSETTVRTIPVDELAFKEFGSGHKLKRRRYRLADVEAYEAVDVRDSGKRRAS